MKFIMLKNESLPSSKNCKLITPNSKLISMETIDQAQTLYELKLNNKYFNILHGDLSNFNTEAIVNFTNAQLGMDDTELDQKIIYLAGIDYQIACNIYLQANKQLNQKEVFVYNFDHDQKKYILSIAYPQSNDEQSITDTIAAVFDEAENNNIDELTFTFDPIQMGQNYDIEVQKFINGILFCLYQNGSTIEKVNLIENSPWIQKLIEITKSIIKAPVQRCAQFQWQWGDQNGFKDYDRDINEQIDIAYEQFLQDKKKNELKLIFPYTKTPGTHLVNLTTNTLFDKDLKTEVSIEIGLVNTLIDGKVIDINLHQFLRQNRQQRILEFEIFYKRYAIIFSGTHTIQQVNEVTNFKRIVEKIPLKQQRSKLNCFSGTQYQVNEWPLVPKTENTLSIELLENANHPYYSAQIKSMIRKNLINITVNIPYFKEPHMTEFLEYIKKNSVEIKGQLKPNENIDIVVFKNKVDKIRQFARNDKIIRYPKEWQYQDKNLLKVQLIKDDPEFQKINDLFMNSYPGGEISRIYRIQNQLLWENYIIAKNKILDYYEKLKVQLQDSEKQMYAWHGVKLQHPKIIYEGELQAFDTTFSKDDSLWGRGIYFAEQAIYSKSYSHRLLPNQEPGCDGQLTFLCCLITTGKTYFSQMNYEVKRPPKDYSCVCGVNCGCRVYALYDMGVHRAYPSYEVIYQ